MYIFHIDFADSFYVFMYFGVLGVTHTLISSRLTLASETVHFDKFSRRTATPTKRIPFKYAGIGS